MVLCHGTPWSSVVWEPVVEALSSEYTVYTFDMPGYGRSSKHSGHDVDLGVQGELFADMLKMWGLEAPHVVAHDFGGAVALRAHLLHNASVASLCLIDVVVLRPWGSVFFRLVRDHAEAFSALPAPIHEAVVAAYIAGASHEPLRAAQLDAYVTPWVGEDGQPAFYRQIAQADEKYTDPIEERLGDLTVPVRVMWGAEDRWLPVESGERLRTLVPGAQLEVITGAGHLVQEDRPAALGVGIYRWLRELDQCVRPHAA